jgi:DNA-binding GntR family transcriptional regulator
MTTQLQMEAGRTLAEQVASKIKTAIFDAQFGPGQRLVERELMELLGLGRGPIREALRLLSVEGLVTIERNKGAVVARASKAIVAEVLEVRELIEGLSARCAARRIREGADSTGLRALLAEEEARDIEGDTQSLIEANDRLHHVITATGSNKTAERVLDHIQLPKLRALFFKVMSPAGWRTSRDEHLEILQAILGGEEETAERLMRAHVRRASTLFASLPEALFTLARPG